MKFLKKAVLTLLLNLLMIGGFLIYRYFNLSEIIGSEPAFYDSCNRLVFTSERSGSSQIYSIDLKSRQETQITESASEKHYPVVSPDQKWLAFVERNFHSWVLSKLDFNTGKTTELVELGTFNPMRASWSHDSKRILFPAVRDDVIDIYSFDLRKEKETLLIASPGDKTFPVFLRGDSSIAYVESIGGDKEVMVTDLNSQTCRSITDNNHMDSHLSANEDGTFLTFKTKYDGSEWVNTYDLSTGQEKLVKEIKGLMYYPSTCHGGRFAFVLDEKAEISIYLWDENSDIITKVTE